MDTTTTPARTSRLLIAAAVCGIAAVFGAGALLAIDPEEMLRLYWLIGRSVTILGVSAVVLAGIALQGRADDDRAALVMARLVHLLDQHHAAIERTRSESQSKGDPEPQPIGLDDEVIQSARTVALRLLNGRGSH